MPSDAKNLKSALEQPGVVRQKIQAEIEKGRVAGPFIYLPIKTLRVLPIGLVPKKEPNQLLTQNFAQFNILDLMKPFI